MYLSQVILTQISLFFFVIFLKSKEKLILRGKKGIKSHRELNVSLRIKLGVERSYSLLLLKKKKLQQNKDLTNTVRKRIKYFSSKNASCCPLQDGWVGVFCAVKQE